VCNAPELTLAKLDAWLAMADVDSEFEAVVAPRHNTNVRYALWQVSLKTYPAATILTDWHDYSNDENIALESNLNNHRPGCTISAAEQIDPRTESAHGDWTINFDTMHQTNSITGTVRLVRHVIVTHQAEPV
jgi:hypothetical protein